jgi:hypothetical protein
MAASGNTVAWIGAGGIIIGAAVGAISGWASAAIASSRARRDAQDDRRRAAYAAFLGALDGILSLTLTEPTETDYRLDHDPEYRKSVSHALESINRTCVDVTLVGSEKARTKVTGIEDVRWGAVGGLDPKHRLKLHQAIKKFAHVSTNFTDLARNELAGRAPFWRRIFHRMRPPGEQGDQEHGTDAAGEPT